MVGKKMEYEFRFVEVTNSDFQGLIRDLDIELHQMYGDIQESFDVHNTTNDLETIAVIYYKDRPIGCGAYKQFSPDTMEIKRVYVAPEYRNQGIAQELMKVLELDGLHKGYQKVLLETGKKQMAAVKSYTNRGYVLCDAYGPYIGNPISICMTKELKRCFWAGDDPIYQQYHDEEWGVPLHDERKLFEMLILEGAQAGLSWITILKRRDGYRQVFDGFDWNVNANYTDAELEEKLLDSRIIRNRLKVFSVRTNAIAFQKIREEFGSFDRFIWSYVNYDPILNSVESREELQASTSLSDTISKDLKKRGFKFVGTTIIYSYMQAIGMVNDHLMDCVVY